MAIADAQPAVDPGLLWFAPVGAFLFDAVPVGDAARLRRVGARDQRAEFVDADGAPSASRILRTCDRAR